MAQQRLKGKTIVITGASSGIGEALAYAVARVGGTPILLSRSKEKLECIRASIYDQHQIEAGVYPLDVGNFDQVQTVFHHLLQVHPHVDALINNAGFGVFDYFTEASLHEIEEMFDVNVLGLMACTQAVLPSMLDRDTGHIINIASLAGKVATPKSSVYAATKHAVLGFTNALRMELADTSVRVTAVNPGPVRTRFFSRADPDGSYLEKMHVYMLTPEEVADKIIKAVGTNRREINLPWSMNTGARLYQIFPRMIEKIAGRVLRQK